MAAETRGRGAGDFLVRFLASGGFVSYIPARLTGFKKYTGSGLAGTVVALALAPFLPQNPLAYAAFCAAFLPFSVWIAGLAAESYGVHDDPRIVIDEIIGYWLALAFIERTVFNMAAAFVLFRVLDTLKPWPIRVLDRKVGGGFGIIIDDVLAGAEANLLTRLAALAFLKI